MFYIRGASFWQQDQAWQARSQANQSDLDVITAVTAKLSSALTNLSSGLAGIANQRALSRVNAQLHAAATAAVKASTTSSTSGTTSSGITGNSVNKTV